MILNFVPLGRSYATPFTFLGGIDHESEKNCVSIIAVDSAPVTFRFGMMRNMLVSKEAPMIRITEILAKSFSPY